MSKFIEKKSDNSFLLHVYVKPNSKKQDIIDNGDFITILLRSKAVQNKANKELLNLLKKKLKIPTNQIKIISGVKNTDKLIKLTFSENINEKEIFKRLMS